MSSGKSVDLWVQQNLGGITVGNTFEEIKQFAFAFFSTLDEDRDGFLSDTELRNALESAHYDLKQKAFITLLLRRIEDIESTYSEEWASGRSGISLVDIQEFFATPE